MSIQNMSDLNILIATPCYGGVLHNSYFDSIIKLITVFNSAKINYNIVTIPNESLIQRGRNFYVSMMLTYPKFTHLFFIDSDIGFDANQTLNMVLRNKDITCGIYPKKNLDLNKLKKNLIEANPAQQNALNVHPSVIENVTLDYVVNILNGQISINDNLIEVDYAGTGFMLIKADVIRYMSEMMPETKFNNDVEGYFVDNGANANNFYSLFDCIIDPVSKRYLSEDYTFMNRAQKLGVKCYVDLSVNLTHTGNRTYNGSFMNFIYYHSIIGNVENSNNTNVLNDIESKNKPTPDPNVVNNINVSVSSESSKEKDSINPEIDSTKLSKLLLSDE